MRRIRGTSDITTLGLNVEGHCRERSIQWLVDTGASTSLLSRKVWEMLENPGPLDPTNTRMTTAGYWQVAMDEADREKTAVCTHQGPYQFQRMLLFYATPLQLLSA